MNKKLSFGENEIIKGNKFHVSYAVAGSGPTGDETALVFTSGKDKKGKTFLILNGDWRNEYKKLVPKGLKKCKEFFKSKEEDYKNFWSN